MTNMFDHPTVEVGAAGAAAAGITALLAKVGKGVKNLVSKAKKGKGDGSNNAAALELVKSLTKGQSDGGGSDGGAVGSLVSMLSGLLAARQASPGGAVPAPSSFPTPTPYAPQAAQVYGLQSAVGPRGLPYSGHLAGMRSPYLWPGFRPAVGLPAMSAAIRNFYAAQARPMVYVGALDFDDEGETYVGATDDELDDSLGLAADLAELDREIARLDEEEALAALATLADSLADVEVGAVSRRVSNRSRGSRSRRVTGNRTSTRRRTTSNRTRRQASQRTTSNRRTRGSAVATSAPPAVAMVESAVQANVDSSAAVARRKQRQGLLARLKAASSGAGPVGKRRLGSRIARLKRANTRAAQVPRLLATTLTQAAVMAAAGDSTMFFDRPEGAEVLLPGKDGNNPYATAVIAAGTNSASFTLTTADVEVGTFGIKGLEFACSIGLNKAGANIVDSLKGGVLIQSVTPNKKDNLLIDEVFFPFDSDDGTAGKVADAIESLRYDHELGSQQNVVITGQIILGDHATDAAEYFLSANLVGQLNEQR